ncbi:DgyrCDS7657 [Dimorphilus gyrociliatus]|uniref:DgyrCDS7657 n=1 Tax=Dimorphilus gyrociliatus TaxID=2664684 RepID=A0A7I8VRR3_9ANNE|nr:DgyrCDS7657 [Dimorphilus gyrociliatus]
MASLSSIIFGRNYLTNSVLLFLCVLAFIYVVLMRKPSLNNSPFDDITNFEAEIENPKHARVVAYKHRNRIEDKKLTETTSIDESVAPPIAEKKNVEHYREIWLWADAKITRDDLIPGDEAGVDVVLNALATAPITHVGLLDIGSYESGTSQKWIIFLEGGQQAMMKLVWQPEEKGFEKRDGACNFGFESPTSEIAAFHLHRILDFHNTPYVTGRKVKLSDIQAVSSPQVNKQFVRKGEKLCVVGGCYYCKGETTLCPSDGIVEVSIAYWVHRHLKLYTFPPKYMPFSTPRRDEWSKYGFNNDTYCKEVRKIPPYSSDWYYHDLFDFSLVDTIMHHYDSKHYVIHDHSKAHGLTVRLDHGRTFCSLSLDEYDVFLVPITQCCKIRKKTWKTIENFEEGDISNRLKQSLKTDPIAPILLDAWYPVIERRLKKIKEVITKCADANGWDNVLVTA